MEVSPEFVYQFLSLCLSGVFGVLLTVAVVLLLLVVDDRSGDSPSEEVFQPLSADSSSKAISY